MHLDALNGKNGINADGMVIIQFVGESGRDENLIEIHAGRCGAKTGDRRCVIGVHAAIAVNGEVEDQIGGK